VTADPELIRLVTDTAAIYSRPVRVADCIGRLPRRPRKGECALLIADVAAIADADDPGRLDRLADSTPCTGVILIGGSDYLNQRYPDLARLGFDFVVKPVAAPTLALSMGRALYLHGLQVQYRREQELSRALQERRLDEMEALHEAGRAINRTLGLQETLVTTMSVARSLVRASISNVYLYTSDHGRLDSVVTLGDDAPLTNGDRRRAAQIAQEVVQRVTEGSISPLLSSSASDTSEGDGAHQSEPGVHQHAPNCHIHSWLAVPLVVGDVPIGVLQLGSERPAAFSVEDSHLLRVIAAQAATSIRNARLYEEAQQRLRQTEALDEITRSINNTLDETQVLHLVVRSAVRTIPVAAHSSLYLYDARRGGFVLQSRFGRYDGPEPTELDAAVKTLISQLRHDQGVVCSKWGPGSLLLAPLVVNERVIGAICVHSPFADAFSNHDERFLASFARHAATAIQNANLFRDLRNAYASLAHQQAEILSKQSTLQALFDSITDGLYIVDDQLRVVAVNRREAERLGADPDALLGRPCDEGLWGTAAAEISRLVRDTIVNRRGATWESPADEAGPFAGRDVHTYPIFNPTGQVDQVIILAQDMAEKRWLQASLFRSANMAAVGQLASSIAHQINNPLTVVMANAQLMQMNHDPQSPDYAIISDIVQGSIRISQIVRHFLDFASPDDYDWGEVDVAETIEHALSFTVRSLYRSNIEVEQHLPADLPQIIASASQLKVVWMNLLLNARDAIVARLGQGSAEERGRVEIRADQPDPAHVRVEIVDNGEGVSTSNRERLFHPFFTTRPPGAGIGLGLFTSRKIVECHQGTIEIENNVGRPGAVARVTLPLVGRPSPGEA
jgi:two-component system NtrC family sensor kinase